MDPLLRPHPDEVRRFLMVLNGAAARAFDGIDQPGMLQIIAIHPAGGRVGSRRFPIGTVDEQVAQVLRLAAAGFNVYVEGRTIDGRAVGRGNLAATRGVFALVIDSDADKGMAGSATVRSSLVVETSPGNYHKWLFLDRALTAEEAKPIGEALRAAVGADHDSGTLTQPYRVAGTPNFVSSKKAARGRVPSPTRVLEHSGRTWTADELRAAFPPRARERATFTPAGGRSGKTSVEVEALLAECGPDRSARFHAAVFSAIKADLTVEDFEDLARRHPTGCAGKYLHPYDRLRREIARSGIKAWEQSTRRDSAPVEPTFSEATQTAAEARVAVKAAVDHFFADADAWASNLKHTTPPIHAVAVSTGVGKTSTAVRRIAEWVQAFPRSGNVIYAVPTHRLGFHIEALFRHHGIRAKFFLGRQAPDPDRPANRMCVDLEAVATALALGAHVSTSCCKGRAPNGNPTRCDHFARCAYQQQMMEHTQVWVVTHQLLFQAPAALGEPALVVIDESFWPSGLLTPERCLTTDEIAAPLRTTMVLGNFLKEEIETHRGKLARALRRQTLMGGVRREQLVASGLSADDCSRAIAVELSVGGKAALWPGMPRDQRLRAAQAAAEARHVRAFVDTWRAARELLSAEDPATRSGWLYLEERDGEDGRVTTVRTRGIRRIAERWRVPTLVLDAMSPEQEILRAYYPQAVVTARIEAAMPHTKVRQVLGAPVSATKLALRPGDIAGRNLRAVRRYILSRYCDIGRAPTLVVAQKAVADWLRTTGLPPNIAVEHFNNVAGLDLYGDVRLVMVIGRTAPTPREVEALAGALSGLERASAGPWHDKAVRGIRLRGGPARAVECDHHPDPLAEACRWQICEGQLMQAIGRARGVNRTADTPLDIDVLANVCLPLTVDEVVTWEAPGEQVEMAADGVVLDGASDMATAWPDVWATPKAAERWLARRRGGGAHSPPNTCREGTYTGFRGAVAFRYQRPGARQKWRTGAFDPSVVFDPRAWLSDRFGPLAGFQIAGQAAEAEGRREAAE